MMADYIIRQWKASYYINFKKKWVYGQLMVTPDNVTFLENCDPKRKSEPLVSLRVRYEEFSEIRKASSSFVYKALIIFTCTGKVQHWFASLPNRDSVYNVVEHFWRDRLISSKKPTAENDASKGKELLKIALDSEKTLEEAAKTLKKQGEQLENALGVVCDINCDLTVVENLTSNLESWLGRWPSSRVLRKPEAMDFISPKGVPIIHEFPVIYSKPEKAERAINHRGNMRVSRDGITILNSEQYPVHHYRPPEISEIVIISPWEIKVSQLRLGQPDTSFMLSSTRMVRIVKALEPVYQAKFQYSEPPVELLAAFCKDGSEAKAVEEDPRDDGHESEKLSKEMSGKSSPSDPPRSVKRVSWSSDDYVVQTQIPLVAPDRQSGVSEEEVDELTSAIGRMKDMAMDIANEQDRQFETIDTLTQSVDRADARLRFQTKKIDNLQ